jgi:hypothetical protein
VATNATTILTPTAIDPCSLPKTSQHALKALEAALLMALEFIADGAPLFKAYEGDDPLKHIPMKKYYDEREWRACSDGSEQFLTFTWADIEYICCSTKQDCDTLFRKRKEFAETIKMKPMSRLWQKLISFEEIDSHF